MWANPIGNAKKGWWALCFYFYYYTELPNFRFIGFFFFLFSRAQILMFLQRVMNFSERQDFRLHIKLNPTEGWLARAASAISCENFFLLFAFFISFEIAVEWKWQQQRLEIFLLHFPSFVIALTISFIFRKISKAVATLIGAFFWAFSTDEGEKERIFMKIINFRI